jgi:hypothetical protein
VENEEDLLPAPEFTNENYWECEACSVTNEESIKRCQNCGKSRHDPSSPLSGKIQLKDTTNEDESDQALLASLNPTDYHYKSIDSIHQSKFKQKNSFYHSVLKRHLIRY